MHLENNSNPRKNSRYESMSVFFFFFLVKSHVRLLILKINQYYQDQTNYRIKRERERDENTRIEK